MRPDPFSQLILFSNRCQPRVSPPAKPFPICHSLGCSYSMSPTENSSEFTSL